MSTLEFFGAAVGLMRVWSEGSKGRVGEQRGREDEKEEEGRKRREGRGEVEERREWKEPRSTMMDKWSSLKRARNGRKRKREVIQMG